MSTYETIRQKMLEILRQDPRIPKDKDPQIVKDLDAYAYTLKRVPAFLVERFPAIRRVPEANLEAQAAKVRATCRQLRDAMEAEWRALESQVTAAEKRSKAIVQSDNFDVMHADQFRLGTVDSLLAIPRIKQHVKRPGSRLLVLRPRRWKTLDAPLDLFCLEHTCSFEICDSEKQLVASLSKNDTWLLIFGCGSGFVTDSCLYVYAPVARTMMPITTAVANMLQDAVERMARERWVRATEDELRLWKPRE